MTAINTVDIEFLQRDIEIKSISRTTEVETPLRGCDIKDINRTVEVEMTYTLEEWYFAGPFHLVDELEEVTLHGLPDKTI